MFTRFLQKLPKLYLNLLKMFPKNLSEHFQMQNFNKIKTLLQLL